jgi:fructose-1,6-bisphosphatase/inositol monophosphatase family enzyme
MKDETTAESLITTILGYVEEAGRIACSLQSSVCVSEKADSSPVTEVDLLVSDLGRRVFTGPLFSTEEFLYLDEELFDRGELEVTVDDVIQRTAVIVDPIGGTKGYVSGLPFFGTYVGVLKQGVPWLGAIYLPALRELFFTDGTASYFERDPFTSYSHRERIFAPVPSAPDRILFGPTASPLIRPPTMNAYGLGVSLTWPLLGRGAGAIFQAKLWDCAGQWAIAQNANCVFLRLSDGQVVSSLLATDFDSDFMMRGHFLLAHEEAAVQLRATRWQAT